MDPIQHWKRWTALNGARAEHGPRAETEELVAEIDPIRALEAVDSTEWVMHGPRAERKEAGGRNGPNPALEAVCGSTALRGAGKARPTSRKKGGWR